MIDANSIMLAILALGVSVARMSAMFVITPFFAPQYLTGVVRNGVILSLAVIVWPMVLPAMPAGPLPPVLLLALLVKEAVIGVLLGFVASFPFHVAESVGFFIDNQKGTTMASVFNPLSGEQTSPTGVFFSQAAITLFFSFGGFLVFLEALFDSYQAFPIFEFSVRFPEGFPQFILGYVDLVGRTTVLYAAPVIVCLFIAEFGLGLMNRFAPQLNVFALAMPVKAGLAAFVLVLYMGFLFAFFKNTFVESGRLLTLLKGLLAR
jgi:type III secretion protein T